MGTLIAVLESAAAVAGALLCLWAGVRVVTVIRRRVSLPRDQRGGARVVRRLDRTPDGYRALGLAWSAMGNAQSPGELEGIVVTLLARRRPPYHFIAALLDAAVQQDGAVFSRILSEHHIRLRHLGLVGLSRATAVPPSLRPILLAEYGSTDESRHVAAVRPLLATYAREPGPPRDLLSMLVTDADWRVRAATASVLARWPSPPVVAFLRQLLGDPRWPVRHAAAHSLASFGNLGWRALHLSLQSRDPFEADMAGDAVDHLAAITASIAPRVSEPLGG